ncbi:MAG TPA: haloacid dehalogenase-like hydrolase [Arcobacter sp.]|nr:haloacid dehalogenase-like hydrolase [Arcobacter sp.]
MSKNIAFFDFDGTIIRGDSLIEFIKFVVGDFNYYKGLFFLSPMLILYRFKLIKNDVAKERLLSYYFRGYTFDEFQKLGNQFSLNEIDRLVYEDALKRFLWHQENGDEVVIVSASIECWLQAWCKKNGIDLISTKLATYNNVLTGKFSGKNCYGKEKKNRVLEQYTLDNYDEIYVYGDSKGDRELLTLATKSFYRYFKK